MDNHEIIEWFNNYFNSDTWNYYDLKAELCLLSSGDNEPIVDKCANSFGAEYNSRLYIEIDGTLKKLAKKKWLEMETT